MRFACFFAAMVLAFAAVARADQDQTYSGPLSASEQTFLQQVKADLEKRFPTAADAEKAGYVRYTNADNTGAISYANRQWTSTSVDTPSQLWYDKDGNLLGADYSVPYTKGQRPQLFGVNPGRWYEFDDHVHYVLRAAGGQMQYDKYVMAPQYMKAGGDPAHPTADDLAKMHKVASSSQVAAVFDMPSIWDLVVWVKPHAKGAFHW